MIDESWASAMHVDNLSFRKKMAQTSNPYLDLYDAVETRYASASDGIRIAYKRLPARTRTKAATVPLVLVNGFSRLKREWDDFGYELFIDRDLIVIDNRGLDESRLEEGQLDSITTHHTFAEDVLSVVVSEGLKQFHLSGVSMGGYISQYVFLKLEPRSKHYQAKWREQHGLDLLSVTLICCAPKRPYNANSTSPLFKLLDTETAKAQVELDAGRIDEKTFHYRIQFQSWVLSLTEKWAHENPDKIKKLVDREVEEVQAGRKPDAVLKRHREAGHGFDVVEELGKLDGNDGPRYLIVHGDQDALVSNEVGGDLFHRLLPGSKYVLLKEVGHSTYLQDDGETARAMNEFLKEVENEKL